MSSLNAQSGITLNSRDLRVGGGTIRGLELGGQGDLFVSGTLNLIGPSRVRADVFGPGTIVSSGPVELSFANLRGDATFRNQGEASVLLNRLDFFLGASFENEGSLLLASDLGVQGPGTFSNTGRLTYQSPGVSAVFDPEYSQTSGSLEIQAGRLQMRSTRIDLSGGSLSIADGAKLLISSPSAGQQLKSFSGLARVTGLGTLEVLEDMTVAAPLELALGSGFPTSGRGGFLLRGATLNLVADLRNRGRMRFQDGTLIGMGGGFINDGTAYTITTGIASFRADVTNNGVFSLRGPPISLGDGATFTNAGAFNLHAGDISPGPGVAGRFVNSASFVMQADAPNVVSQVRVLFDNQASVGAFRGILRFGPPGLVNLSAGTLSGGTWTAFPGGTLDFPEPIIELFGCNIGGGGQIPDLSSLREIASRSRLRVDDSKTLTLDGPLTVAESSEVFVGSNSTLSIQGATTVKGGAKFRLQGPAVLQATGPVEIGEQPDSAVAELSPIVVIAARASRVGATVPANPTVITPLLNNAFGRVLPMERGSIGTLQLNGTYQQGAGGSLAVEVVDGGSDLLSIAGSASLAGTLELTRLGEVPAGSTFTILTTTGTVTGTFDQVLSPDLFSVTYLPQAVRVTLDASVVTCGDVNGSGFVSAADPILLRQRLVGIGVLQAPDRCNVTGAADALDADGDGLRDDCNIADSVVLRRSVAGLGPALRNDCGTAL